MKKDPRVYLAQILERIDRILAFTSSGKEGFFADVRTQDAVIRNFEVIGEAVKRIPDDYCADHPAIPWRELAGLRDVLIHQYEGVSLNEIWRMVEKDLLPLRQAIAGMLPPLEELERQIAGDEEPPESD